MGVPPATWASEFGSAPAASSLAVDETVILLHPVLPLPGVSIAMERGCQQNDSLVNGYSSRLRLSGLKGTEPEVIRAI